MYNVYLLCFPGYSMVTIAFCFRISKRFPSCLVKSYSKLKSDVRITQLGNPTIQKALDGAKS
jgi:hypothetical protein